jgi:hypothetical protein
MDEPRPADVYFGSPEIAAAEVGRHFPDLANGPSPQSGAPTDEASPAFLHEALRGRRLAGDVEAGAGWENGCGLFHGWHAKVCGALDPAYPVYLHFKNDEYATLDEVLRQPPFDERKRRPKRGTLAVVALTLVAKPKTLPEQKIASEYATALIWAAAHEILPSDFADRVSAEGLTACRDFARDLRAKSRKPRSRKADERVEPASPETAAPIVSGEDAQLGRFHDSRTDEPSEPARRSSPGSRSPPAMTSAVSLPMEDSVPAASGPGLLIALEGKREPRSLRLSLTENEAAAA